MDPLGDAVRILVADDDPIGRELLHRWITRSTSAEVILAENGLRVLEVLASGPVDVIVLDVNMPQLDGIECLSVLRADPAYKDLEVMIASQVKTEARVREAIALGVSDYILKPLHYDTVSTRLREAVKRVLVKREERASQKEGDLPRVLVADPDPNFCEFARSALAGRYVCDAVRTGGETLVKILRWQPDLLLLSPQMPGLALDFLLNKIGTMSSARRMKIHLLADSLSEAPLRDGVAGSIPHTFVPETFRSQVAQFLGIGGAPGRGILSWVHALEPEILTALRQALGMMTGTECAPAEEPAAAPAFDVFAQIGLEAVSKEFVLSLELECHRALAQALLASMLGSEEGVSDIEAQNSGIGEILNVIAGRIENSCSQRKMPMQFGLPKVTDSAPPRSEEADYLWRGYFRWEKPHEFRLLFRAASLPGAG